MDRNWDPAKSLTTVAYEQKNMSKSIARCLKVAPSDTIVAVHGMMLHVEHAIYKSGVHVDCATHH